VQAEIRPLSAAAASNLFHSLERGSPRLREPLVCNTAGS